MADEPNARSSNVVDFLQFRAARDRQRLPLFDDPSEARVDVVPLSPSPGRTLSPREIDHRVQMLRHLEA